MCMNLDLETEFLLKSGIVCLVIVYILYGLIILYQISYVMVITVVYVIWLPFCTRHGHWALHLYHNIAHFNNYCEFWVFSPYFFRYCSTSSTLTA